MDPTNTSSGSPDILRELLEACKREYSDRWDTFKHLDSKAHNLIGVAGVLLSAVLVSLRIGSGSLDNLILIPLFVAVVSLVVTIGLGSWSQLVSNVRQPINLTTLERIARDLLALEPDDLSRLDFRHKLDRTLIRMFSRSLGDVSRAIWRKGWRIHTAQITLLLAVLSTGFALTILIWSKM